MQVNEDDIVVCTVKKIEGTTVFLRIEGDGEGSISFPEVAAGRIRNIRDYVVPNKKIVCKVLRVISGNAQLSLRRVTAKERDEAKEEYEKEKTLTGMLKSIVKEPKEIVEKIKGEMTVPAFLEEAKENPKIIEQFLSKSESQVLLKILLEKREKDKIVKEIISIKSSLPDGIKRIKAVLDIKDAKINYLGSSKFLIEISGKDFKELNTRLSSILREIEKRAKDQKIHLEVQKK